MSKQATIHHLLEAAGAVDSKEDLDALLATVVDPDDIHRHAARLGIHRAIEAALNGSGTMELSEFGSRLGSMFLTGFSLGIQVTRMVDDPAFGQEVVTGTSQYWGNHPDNVESPLERDMRTSHQPTDPDAA